MNTQHVKIVNCDPSALGLFGLAMVTLVASSQKLGITSDTSFVIPWAIFLGGFAQLFACINDSKRNNVLGTTTFGGFALFWFAVGASWMIKGGVFGETLAAGVDGLQLGFAFLGYLIFSLFLTFGFASTNKVLFIDLIFIDLLFIGLTLSSFGIMHLFSHNLAAVSELAISMISFYGFGATVLNQHYGKIILPLGKPIVSKEN
ncbi:MAG: acetate uptake transporter [Bacteroidales bacterium]|jgi:succinate-acetate transporter protein|nr:acetate uptake transporter [Bacteroidales bacterium]